MITKAQRTILRKILLGKLTSIGLPIARTLARKKLIHLPDGDRIDPRAITLTAVGRRLADIKSVDHQAPGAPHPRQAAE